MRRKFLPFVTIAIMVLFVACSNEELLPEVNAEANLEETRTLSLTATMPGDNPTTRVALVQDGKDINLTWELNDVIELAFVHNVEGVSTKIKGTATVSSISNNGKTAQFNITVPAEVTASTFDLYGVYGGGGLDNSNPTNVKLPVNAGEAVSLESVKTRKDVMLYFESKGVTEAGTTGLSVTFKHLGSLFAITIKNTSESDIKNIEEVRITGVDAPVPWAYNTGPGGQIYDFLGGFQNTGSGSGNYIEFKPVDVTFEAGKSTTLWSWYPPLPDLNWPELKVQVRNNAWRNGDTKPARTEATAPGKVYHFYATFNGTAVKFTNDQFVVPTP